MESIECDVPMLTDGKTWPELGGVERIWTRCQAASSNSVELQSVRRLQAVPRQVQV
jgi:hypothetical protein